MPDCLIAFGANLGNSRETYAQAVQYLAEHPALNLTANSQPLVTSPVGGDPNQPEYLNAAIRIVTELPANQLLGLLLQTEQEFGRRRGTGQARWQARTIDLDLLLYGDQVLVTPDVCIPHPRMSFRRFVLEPACDVAPDMVHPVANVSIARLLQIVDKKNFFILLANDSNQLRLTTQKRLLEKNSDFVLNFLTSPSASEIEQTLQPVGSAPERFQQLNLCFVDEEAVFQSLAPNAQLVIVLESLLGKLDAGRSWLPVAKRFAGPCLQLQLENEDVGSKAVSDEIFSACQAMLPIKRNG